MRGCFPGILQFFGESNDSKHVTAPRCIKKVCTKNLENVQKNHEYPRIFEKISAFFAILDVCFYIKRSKMKYLSTEKTSKNLRNSTQ